METRSANKSVVIKSTIGAIIMFMFAIFVLPPLYDLFCEALGIGGKPGGPYQAEVLTIDDTRQVEVQFVVTNNATMPWEFYPVKDKVFVHPVNQMKLHFLQRI